MSIFLDRSEIPIRLATHDAAATCELYERCIALLGAQQIPEELHHAVSAFRAVEDLDPDEIAPDVRAEARTTVDELLDTASLTDADIVDVARTIAGRKHTREMVGVLVPSLQDSAGERLLATWHTHAREIHGALAEQVQARSDRLGEIGKALPSDFNDTASAYARDDLRGMWDDLNEINALIDCGMTVDRSINPPDASSSPCGSWLVRIVAEPFEVATLADLQLSAGTYQGTTTVFTGQAREDRRHALRQLGQCGAEITLRTRESAETFLADNYFGLPDHRRRELVENNEKKTGELGRYFIKNV